MNFIRKIAPLGKQIFLDDVQNNTKPTALLHANFDFIVSRLHSGNMILTQDIIRQIITIRTNKPNGVIIDLGAIDLNTHSKDTLDNFKSLLIFLLRLPAPMILIDCPDTKLGSVNMASIVREVSEEMTHCCKKVTPLIVFRLKIQGDDSRPPTPQSYDSGEWDMDFSDDERSIDGSWTLWNNLRSHLHRGDCSTGVALEITTRLPETSSLCRWLGEPVRMLLVNKSVFTYDEDGSVDLPHEHRKIIIQIMSSQRGRIFITAIDNHIESDDMKILERSLIYVQNEWLSLSQQCIKRFCADRLKIPLQPLSAHLGSHIYADFERDKVKYERYNLAIIKAINVLISDKPREELNIVIFVVGAGRGPLVEQAILAVENANCRVKIYVVEKNPNSIKTLQYQKVNNFKWNRGKCIIDIHEADMRDWEPENGDKADIIVSELLGSFSDNELSPECLDGLWKNSKETTISIPSSYTSYICPILYRDTYSRLADRSLETISVVDMLNYHMIAEPQKLFEFSHHRMDLKPNINDNYRYRELTFECKHDVVCHGFAGFFDATLYPGVELSILPGEETHEMFSWFPAFIPLANAVFVSARNKIQVQFWRRLSTHSVWYEWALTMPLPTPIQSLNSKRTASRAMPKMFEEFLDTSNQPTNQDFSPSTVISVADPGKSNC